MAKLYKSYNELQHQYNQKRKMVIELGITAFLLIALAIGLISFAQKGVAFVCAAVAVTAIAYAEKIFSRELLRNDINVPLIPLVFLVNPNNWYQLYSRRIAHS